MEKEITIAHRSWGTANRRAVMTVLNNRVTVQGFSIGYRNTNVAGPKLENITEVPKKLRKELGAYARHRCPELSRAFADFISDVWKKAKTQDPWFDF